MQSLIISIEQLRQVHWCSVCSLAGNYVAYFVSFLFANGILWSWVFKSGLISPRLPFAGSCCSICRWHVLNPSDLCESCDWYRGWGEVNVWGVSAEPDCRDGSTGPGSHQSGGIHQREKHFWSLKAHGARTLGQWNFRGVLYVRFYLLNPVCKIPGNCYGPAIVWNFVE